MSDIVESLREWSVAVDNGELDGTEDGLLATDLMIAAAEIERLNKDYDTVVERMMEDDEEVERLKTELLEERKKHEWISVKDRLPKETGLCVVTVFNEIENEVFVSDSVFYEGRWVERNGDGLEITNWMPFPDPPKGE